jgi:hypothetical protein
MEQEFLKVQEHQDSEPTPFQAIDNGKRIATGTNDFRA